MRSERRWPSGSIGSGSDTDDTGDELADQHTKSTVDHDGSTTELLNGPEGDWGRADVDEGGDETDEEGVGDGAELLEEGGTEVEDEVDTGPLLHHLERSTQDGSAEIGRRVAESTGEARVPGREVTTLWDDGHLILVVGDNLSKFLLDEFRSRWFPTETGQGNGSLLEIALLDEVTRRFGKRSKTSG